MVFAGRRTLGALAFWVLAAVVLSIPATVIFTSFHAGGHRSWYYSIRNDACQAVAAHGAAQRFGAALEYAVWPGATLNVPYLYRHLLSDASPDAVRGPIAAERLLSESMHFHWRWQLYYSVAFALAFCAFMVQSGVSSILAFAAAALVATNPWYEFQVTQVRPELPALLYVILAAIVANSSVLARFHIVRPIAVGVLVGFAVITKIQIIPLVPFVLILLARRGQWDAYPAVTSRRLAFGRLIGIVLLISAAGFLKSARMANTTYGLFGYPPTAGIAAAAAVAAIALICMAAGGLRRHPRVQAVCEQTLLVGIGAVVALALVVFPSLAYGGWDVLLTTVNRLLFGIASYSRYGLGLPSGSGWGLATSLTEKVWSFVGFQHTSLVPLIENGSLCLWVFALVAICGALVVARRKALSTAPTGGGVYDSRRLKNVSFVALAAAIVVDVTATNRTVNGQPYAFYHIVSLPLYAMAAAAALSAVIAHESWQLNRSSSFVLAAVALIGGLLWTTMSARAIVTDRGFRRPEPPPDAYKRNVEVINGFAPSFVRITGASIPDILRVSTERWEREHPQSAPAKPQ